jgi:hypothetical protein
MASVATRSQEIGDFVGAGVAVGGDTVGVMVGAGVAVGGTSVGGKSVGIAAGGAVVGNGGTVVAVGGTSVATGPHALTRAIMVKRITILTLGLDISSLLVLANRPSSLLLTRNAKTLLEV